MLRISQTFASTTLVVGITSLFLQVTSIFSQHTLPAGHQGGKRKRALSNMNAVLSVKEVCKSFFRAVLEWLDKALAWWLGLTWLQVRAPGCKFGPSSINDTGNGIRHFFVRFQEWWYCCGEVITGAKVSERINPGSCTHVRSIWRVGSSLIFWSTSHQKNTVSCGFPFILTDAQVRATW